MSNISYSFPNTTVLVTGGTEGIGRKTVEYFADAGADVITNDEQEREELPEVAQEYDNVDYMTADVTSIDALDRLLSYIGDEYGTLDVLVNNVGEGGQQSPFETSPENWKFTFDVSVRSGWYLSDGAINELDCSRVINISSIQGTHTYEGMFPYNVANAAVNHLTRTLAIEAPEDVTVNTISPGEIDVTTRNPPKEDLVDNSETELVGRNGRPRDVANVVCFLAAEETDFITGEVLFVEGGRIHNTKRNPSERGWKDELDENVNRQD